MAMFWRHLIRKTQINKKLGECLRIAGGEKLFPPVLQMKNIN